MKVNEKCNNDNVEKLKGTKTKHDFLCKTLERPLRQIGILFIFYFRSQKTVRMTEGTPVGSFAPEKWSIVAESM